MNPVTTFSGVFPILVTPFHDDEQLDLASLSRVVRFMAEIGMDGVTASKQLLERGKIAATPMVNWGSENSSRYLRVVFSNEPIARLRGIGQRFKQALV